MLRLLIGRGCCFVILSKLIWGKITGTGEIPVPWKICLETASAFTRKDLCTCIRSAESEPVIEHLVVRQGQPRGAQVYAIMQCSWVTRRAGARIHPFPDLSGGLAVEVRVSC